MLTVCFVVGSTGWLSAQESPPVLAPRIVCDQPVFEFGERENTETVEHHFVIRNDGDLSLEIRGVRAGCGCTAVKPDDSIVPPGGETKIQTRFNLRGRSGQQNMRITVQSNDPQTPTLTLQLRGTALEGLRAQPSTLFFGRLNPDAPRTRTFEILSGRAPFQITSIRAEQEGLVVRPLEPEPGDDNKRYRFELILDHSLPEGTLNTRVVIQTDAPGPSELTIPVAAYLVPAPPSP